MITVTLMDNAGRTDSSNFFTLSKAMDYYNFARCGKYSGGTIVRDSQRMQDFGVLRDGTTVREARKVMRERAG